MDRLERLRACDIVTKKQWLESVRLAREQYEAPEAAAIMENSPRRAMRQWLFPNEDLLSSVALFSYIINPHFDTYI